MARDFTGANTTPRLSVTLGAAAPPAATSFSVGCWCLLDAWVVGRSFVGTGTSAASWSGLQSGTATAQRFGLKINCATTDMVVEVAAATTGVWICVVATYPNSLTATNTLIYTGSQSSAMASQAHVVDTNGSGAVTGNTAAQIGKNTGSGTAIDGRVAQAFWVPWVMTVGEIEQYRQGDWSVLFRGGNPTFFNPLQAGTAGLYDLALRANWTATSAPADVADPPIAAGWGKAGATWVETELHTATEYPQDVGDGAITPTGEPEQLVIKDPFTGGLTPAGAITNVLVYSRSVDGAFTPAGALLNTLVSKNPSGAITPAGQVDAVISHSAFTGAITPTGATPKVVNKSMTGAFN